MQATKYPSTSQFRNVIRAVNDRLTYDGRDENGNIKRKVASPDQYLIPYVGTVKIHGTNCRVVFNSEDEVVYQSKERVLSLEEDNYGFMAFMVEKDHKPLLEQVKQICEDRGIEFKFPVEIAGEFAGEGIQKDVAVSEIMPFFTIFRVAVGKENDHRKWLALDDILGIGLPEQRIYNILTFGKWELDIPFNMPETVQSEIAQITEGVEKECPVGKYFGVTGVGEGVVWTPKDRHLAHVSALWFKVQGQKHSVSKVKTLAAVDPVKLQSIKDFVEYAVTENRLQQGLQEIGLDIASLGAFIAWVNRDINKEEADVLEANSLSMKDVAKFTTNKARSWYMEQLNEVS